MAEKELQQQINDLNRKLDLVLDYVNQQRLKSEAVEDLISDVAIVGNDIYKSTVTELENQAVEIDPDQLRVLGVKLLKNIGNFGELLHLFEGIMDFMKDATPIANEMIIDFTRKLNELDQKGYFEFFAESLKIVDNVITHFSREDIRQLADNIVTIMETVKNITQPEMLSSLNSAVKVYQSLDVTDVPEYSVFGLLREMRKPEMKRAIGFTVNFLKNLSASATRQAS
jgi:uncharacterized protein YjgD (DUF1641 family)